MHLLDNVSVVEYANLQNVEFAAGFVDSQHFFTALYPPSYMEYRFFLHFAFAEGYRTKNFNCSPSFGLLVRA
jgi:hypothetical protein